MTPRGKPAFTGHFGPGHQAQAEKWIAAERAEGRLVFVSEHEGITTVRVWITQKEDRHEYEIV